MSYSTEQEFRKLWRAVKCKQNCLGISSSGDESLFLNQQGDWVEGGGGASDTIYTADGSISEARTVTIESGDKLEFVSGNYKISIGENLIGSLDGCIISSVEGGVQKGVIVTSNVVFLKNGNTEIQVFDGDIEIELSNSGSIKIYDQTSFNLNLPSYADDAAAGVAGLVQGDFYQTSGSGAAPLNIAGIVMVKQ